MKYSFKTAAELLKLCKEYKKPISEIAIRYEVERSRHSREEVLYQMCEVRRIMKEAVQNGVSSSEMAVFRIAGGDAKKAYLWLGRRKGRREILSSLSVRAMAYAIATGETNVNMGRIAAFPTAGGAGVVPGTTFAYAEEKKLSDDEHIKGLFTASAIGMLIAHAATLSAAVGGCQAEVGAGVAMAASAICEMSGGSAEDCLNASAIGLKSYLGLVCDPLGGLVAVPCIKRNALGCNAAFGAVELTHAGIKTFIPFDEVLFAMNNIAQIMSTKLKETARGGLAVTPTGNKIKKALGMKISK